MAERELHYLSEPTDLDALNRNTLRRGVTPNELRWSAEREADHDGLAPLFLSGDQDEPFLDEYIVPVRKRRVSVSTRVLTAVCTAAAVAVLFAWFSSDAMQDFINAKASLFGIFPGPATTAQANPAPVTPTVGNDSTRSSAPGSGTEGASDAATPNSVMANVAPSREDVKSAYQNLLQARAPAVAPVDAPAPPVEVLHRLDANEIAASRKRAEALIASGDISAARLVLRRPADDGDAQAAIALAGTYDPTVLEKLGVHGIVPDIVTARAWYEKARKFGATEATQRPEIPVNRSR
jgi:hypothetical protein